MRGEKNRERVARKEMVESTGVACVYQQDVHY